MKVMLVNGSPHERGCTYTAMRIVADALNSEGIETQFFPIGTKPLAGCTACKKCVGTGRCIFNDRVNEFLDLAGDFDGFVFGSPIHFAAVGGAMTSFLNRAFYAGSRSESPIFRLKPAAAVVSARRAGTTVALDQINKYFAISQMPVVSSRYWNMVHGATPDEVLRDLEGCQIMSVLGKNMAFLLKCLQAGNAAGVSLPKNETPQFTNFIR